MIDVKNSVDGLAFLSTLLIGGENGDISRIRPHNLSSDFHPDTLKIDDLRQLWALANSHHVILRSFPLLQQMMSGEGNTEAGDWAAQAIANEQARIHRALTFLAPICQGLEQCGNVVVIKSLDHWPDLGSDLDLYTAAEPD